MKYTPSKQSQQMKILKYQLYQVSFKLSTGTRGWAGRSLKKNPAGNDVPNISYLKLIHTHTTAEQWTPHCVQVSNSNLIHLINSSDYWRVFDPIKKEALWFQPLFEPDEMLTWWKLHETPSDVRVF